MSATVMPCVLGKILKTLFFCFFVFLFFVLFVCFFKGACEMSRERFYHLLKFLEPLVLKQKKKIQKPISAGENLSITLRFLATTELHQSLSFSSRMGRSTVSNITSEMCDAIYNVLWKTYLQRPSSADELLFKQKISSNDGICLM